ncbi:hypothetical protein Pmani_000251 [Petrolisthes manimaculis]|uniref:Uncharacterized protein n=1 Tax=Petrolisthes manimaculis TaxID=1843537 RepID=A0AAE1QN49_9EUCA|nr:hypothetical protein Pmani_000251 [Petrolisthes manimaculis]
MEIVVRVKKETKVEPPPTSPGVPRRDHGNWLAADGTTGTSPPTTVTRERHITDGPRVAHHRYHLGIPATLSVKTYMETTKVSSNSAIYSILFSSKPTSATTRWILYSLQCTEYVTGDNTFRLLSLPTHRNFGWKRKRDVSWATEPKSSQHPPADRLLHPRFRPR